MACVRNAAIVAAMMEQIDCLRVCITLLINNTDFSHAFPFPLCMLPSIRTVISLSIIHSSIR